MSLPFESSIRSLHADREWPALTVLLCAIVLFALWIVWFLRAPISHFETGRVVGITRSGTLVANFPVQLQSQLQPGQWALVHMQDAERGSGAADPVPAMVMLVDPKEVDGQIAVQLASLGDARFDRDQLTGAASPLVVDVEVEQLSPAQVVLRSSGQWIDTPSIQLSPQSR